MRREGHAATAAILTAEKVAGPQRVSHRTAYNWLCSGQHVAHQLLEPGAAYVGRRPQD